MLIKKLYHALVSPVVRTRIHKCVFYYRDLLKKRYFKKTSEKIRAQVISYYESANDTEIQNIVAFLKSNEDIIYPYPFVNAYKKLEIPVFRENGFPVIMHNNVKMYGKMAMTNNEFREYYTRLLLEQDERSPHHYLTDNRYPKRGGVIADIGGAEGIFSLNVLSYAKHIYIFECDELWLAALEHTFAPFKDKVEIVRSYIGDKVSENMTTLDTFFRDKELDFLKADIEGFEEAMLEGGSETFQKKIKQALLCCYHRKDSEQVLKSRLVDFGFKKVEVNPGWMIWIYAENVLGTPLSAPYLRHGVLYAEHG